MLSHRRECKEKLEKEKATCTIKKNSGPHGYMKFFKEEAFIKCMRKAEKQFTACKKTSSWF